MDGPYVPSIGPRDARIAIIGEAPGPAEEYHGYPFCSEPAPGNPQSGAAARLLNRILKQVGLARESVFIGNVARYRPPKNRIEEWLKSGPHHIMGKWVHDPIRDGLRELARELAILEPHVIIALGNTAMWALTGLWGINAYRGSQLPDHKGRKVVVSLHPSAVARYGSPRLIAESASIIAQDFRRALRWAEREQDAPYQMPERERTIRPTRDDVLDRLGSVYARLQQQSMRIATDVETALYHIDCIGLAVSPAHSMCIPFVHDGGAPYWSERDEQDVMIALRAVLTHPNARVCGHALSYDAQHMARWWGFIPTVTDDSMVAQHLCFPGGEPFDPLGERQRKAIVSIRKGLDFCASMYTDFYRYWKDDVKHTGELPVEWDKRWIYNCDDVLYSYEIMDRLDALLDSFALREPYTFTMQRWHAVLRMTMRGWLIDQGGKRDAALRIAEAQQALRDELDGLIKPELRPRTKSKKPWYDSPQQTAILLYDILGAVEVKNKEGRRTTDSDTALPKLSKQGGVVGQIAETLLRYRELAGLRNNFIDMPIDVDGRARSGFDVAGPETLRLASRKNAFGTGGNLQNLKQSKED